MSNSKKLTQILREEAEAHRELLRLKSRERDEIIHGKINDLEETISAIGQTVGRIRDLEGCRASMTSAVSIELGIDNSLPTLRELAQAFPEAERQEVLEIGETLRELTAQVRRINGETRYLVLQSLEWMGSLMGQLTGRPIGKTGYNARGDRTGVAGPVLLNQTL
jgi:flagellar biosynthesis/type III secretory pathway chaperone